MKTKRHDWIQNEKILADFDMAYARHDNAFVIERKG